MPSTVKWATGAALFLCLSSPALPQSSDNQPLSCVDNHHNGTIYTVTPGGVNEYDILCGIDYAGADIGAAHANSFEHCIEMCDETEGCIVVSYGGGLGGGGCWMKNKLNTANPNGGIWTARSRNLPEPPVSCEDNRSNGTMYTSATGGEFLVLCGVDHGGGDMGVQDIKTFAGCMDKCDSTPGCVDVSYVGTACYLKSQLGPLNHAGHVWTGRRVSSSSSSTSSSSTSSASSSTAAAAAPTSTDAPTCEQNASDGTSYLTGSNSVWEIVCGREYYGGDLRRETHATFQACIESCDADTECVDVSYVGQDCWMKKSVSGSLVHAPHAWTAKKARSYPSASTTRTATPAPTATSHPSVLTCADKADDGKTYTTDNGRMYEIHCGADFAGGDLQAKSVPSFEDCMHYCDALEACLGVSYASPQRCYPKSKLNDVTTDRPWVWGARFVGIAPPLVPSGTAGDSPPIDTATVVMPEDPEWTATYTWYEQELPTFTSTPVEMPPNPTGTPVCVANPAATPDATFHLIDINRGFIVNRGDRPGNPENPTSEEEANALLDTIDSWAPSLYTWEHPTGAPEGLYDIVLNDDTGKHYLSVTSDGEVVFASESSASTTVFSAGCNGHVTIHRNNIQSGWVANDEGFTTVIPYTTDDRIIVLPPDLRTPAVLSEPEKRSLRQSFRRELGYMPRCPLRGPDIFAVPNPFRRAENPNGCGSGDTGGLVPDLNWGHCCDAHDNCFDNCDKTFQGCNNEFLGCMHAQCRADIKWWNFWMYPGCVAVANFYWLFVSSPAGVVAFYDANSDRCACPCKNPSVEVFCPKPGTAHEVECRNVRQSDNNNCGGCGWTCPYKTRCSRDACVCQDDRCGNVCLDLKTHPNNCGRCGNRCASGFCWQGMCYDPPENPEFCIPGQGLVNGNFPNGNGTGWSSEGSTSNTRLSFGTDGTAKMDMWPGSEEWTLGGGYTASAMLKTTARLCAGVTYDLTFKVKQSWTGSAEAPGCFVLIRVGGRDALSSPLMGFPLASETAWTDRGPFMISPFQEGQGTIVNKVYLGIELIFDLICISIRSGGTAQLALADEVLARELESLEQVLAEHPSELDKFNAPIKDRLIEFQSHGLTHPFFRWQLSKGDPVILTVGTWSNLQQTMGTTRYNPICKRPSRDFHHPRDINLIQGGSLAIRDHKEWYWHATSHSRLSVILLYQATEPYKKNVGYYLLKNLPDSLIYTRTPCLHYHVHKTFTAYLLGVQ
ncbi:hypothetical protein B0H66DRAFT_595135 [Apodospora peruviana]|uniref:Apple domain-containing protein n=1 Tax=Apodospora peruviana TaxID=516989 RepID=A0AAE0HX03_9PEZI|nr:hypothetical protein B0H66DRAFT_595135 [Apodospora peruviana]